MHYTIPTPCAFDTLQPLDVGIFQPLKHWHQIALHDSVQYGDVEYNKVDFLAAYQNMRNKTFKNRTILSAWKKTGLFPYNPQIVLDKVKIYEPDQTAPLEVPLTPKSAERVYAQAVESTTHKPFQSTPTTGNRLAHRGYLNIRLMDFMDSAIPLTPSYCTALLKYQKSVEPRFLEACAIKSCDTARQLQAIEKTRRKTGSGKHIQKNGVIYKGKGRAEAIE